MPLISGAGTPPKPRRKQSPQKALQALHDGSDYARRQAALDLMDVPDAVPALCERLAQETNKPVRTAIIDALVSVGDDRVVDALVDMLRSNDAMVRNEAVIVLQSMTSQVGNRMRALLKDEDPDLRIMALDILRLLPHPEAPKWITEVLKTETHPNVVGVAVDRLADLGGAQHLATLESLKTRFADEPYLVYAIDFVRTRIMALAAEMPR